MRRKYMATVHDGGESMVEGVLREIVEALTILHAEIKRMADHFDPPPPDKVGTPYVAERLGCTTAWITQMVKSGEVPVSCVVEGTGDGKPWKFHRRRIDDWIRSR